MKRTSNTIHGTADRARPGARGRRAHRLAPLAAALLGAWAQAQTAPPAPAAAAAPADGAAEPSSQIESIVVTGERRSSTVQKTPLSITAVTGQQLEEQGITDVARLVTQIPGVSMESEGPGRTNFDMRGLSNSGGSSPTVGFYLDDVPISPPSSPLAAAGKTEIDPDLYDLARVEVLRGPQGTLYGSGSMGGTIRLITNKPNPDGFEASTLEGISRTHGGGTNYTANAMLNVPVDASLALRLVLTDKYDSGFIDRVVIDPFPLPNANGTRGNVAAAPVQAVHKDDNDDHIKLARISALFQATPQLTITPSVFVQGLTTGLLSAFDSVPGTLDHYQPFDSPESSSQDFNLYDLSVKYDFGPVALESVSSALRETSAVHEDDSEALLVAFGPAPTYYPSGNTVQETHLSHQYNEELRLSSNDAKSPVQWVTGFFLSNFSDDTVYHEYAPDYGPIFGTSSVFQYDEPDQIVQRALFGEINDQFSAQWKATLGLRYYHYNFRYSQTESGLASGIPVSDGAASASGFSPKGTLTFTPTDDLLTYGTIGRGFRPGGPNTPIPVAPGGPVNCTSALNAVGLASEPLSYEPDKVTNYEVGEKLRLLGGRVSLNGALYFMDWDKIQQQVTLSCGYNFSANAGKAVSKGGELELNARVTSSLLFTQNFGFSRAYLTQIDVPGNSPLGQQLPDVPRWTYATGLSYETLVGRDYKLTSSLNERFVGAEYDYSGTPAPFTQKPAYHVLDARLRAGRDNWSASLFADNLLNALGIVGVARSEVINIPETARIIPIRPRTIGVDFSYFF